MTRTEQIRLRRILEYNKGFADALLWIQTQQPYDDEIELKIDIVQHKINELENKLKDDK